MKVTRQGCAQFRCQTQVRDLQQVNDRLDIELHKLRPNLKKRAFYGSCHGTSIM
jgi:hypothetical protein